jgi:hypothetical protein
MELNLVGKTVTQAIALLRQALAECEDGLLLVSTDNEAVKLNLYNHVHRLGLRCKAERKGSLHLLQIRLETKPAAPLQGAPDSKGPRATPKQATAFPIAHLGSSEPPKESVRPRRRSLIAPEGEQPLEQSPTPAKLGIRAAVARAMANKQSDAAFDSGKTLPESTPMPIHPDATAWETVHPQPARPQYLVVQSDQIGSRDTALGVDLMEEFLDRIDARRFAGVYLVHRGVRLLDPLYADGRLLRALLRRNLQLTACPRSLAFYQLGARVTIATTPFADVVDLAARYDLLWI